MRIDCFHLSLGLSLSLVFEIFFVGDLTRELIDFGECVIASSSQCHKEVSPRLHGSQAEEKKTQSEDSAKTEEVDEEKKWQRKQRWF